MSMRNALVIKADGKIHGIDLGENSHDEYEALSGGGGGGGRGVSGGAGGGAGGGDRGCADVGDRSCDADGVDCRVALASVIDTPVLALFFEYFSRSLISLNCCCSTSPIPIPSN